MKDEAEKFAINFVVVSISSAFAKTITAPIDRVKLILQNQDSALQVLRGERKKYKGIVDCLIRIPKEQGFASLWRSNGTNILRYFPTQALNFAFNDVYKNICNSLVGDETYFRSFFSKFLSGGFAGACAITIMYPLEFCQTRIAVDVGSDCCKIEEEKKKVKREFHGLFDCIKKIYKADGFRGLYGGYAIAVVGISLYRAFYFGLFDFVKQIWMQNKPSSMKEALKPPVYIAMAFAQTATCVSGFCTYPLDTVARRLMLDSGRPKELQLFTGVLNAFKKMYKTEGFLTFYKGALTNCLRGTSGALVLVFYDEVLHYTQWKKWISPCDNC